MDRYERRRLRENDRYLGKREESFAKFLRTDKHIRDKRRVYEALRNYTPNVSLLQMQPEKYGDLRVVDVDGELISVWLEDFHLHLFPRSRVWSLSRIPLLIRLEERIARGGMERTVWGGPLGTAEDMANFYSTRETDYVFDSTYQHVDIDKSLKKFQHLMDIEFVREHAPCFFRTTERTHELRDELMDGYARMQAILTCKRMKLELMEAVWHPRRVGHILETYGWEVYENLLVE